MRRDRVGEEFLGQSAHPFPMAREWVLFSGGMLAYAGLFYLYRNLNRDPEISHTEQVDRYLRRTDLLDEDEPPQNSLEWVIKFSQLPRVQLLIVGIFALMTVGFTLAGFQSVAGLVLFGTVLAILFLMLFHGWDILESRIEQSDPQRATEEYQLHIDALPANVTYRLVARDRSPEEASSPLPPTNSWTDLKIMLVIGLITVVLLSVWLLSYDFFF